MPWGLSSSSGSSGGTSTVVENHGTTSGSLSFDTATHHQITVNGDTTITPTNWSDAGIERVSKIYAAFSGNHTFSVAGVTGLPIFVDGQSAVITLSSIDGGVTIQCTVVASADSSISNHIDHGTQTTIAIDPAYAFHTVTAGDSLTFTESGWPVSSSMRDMCFVRVISAQGKTIIFPAGSIFQGGVAPSITGTCDFSFRGYAGHLTIIQVAEDVR